MTLVVFRKVGGEEDRVFHVDLDTQILYADLQKKIQLVTWIRADMQRIEFRGERLPEVERPLETAKDWEELVVSHKMLDNWKAYLNMIEDIKQMTTSGLTPVRREIASDACLKASIIRSSDFFLAHIELALDQWHIADNMYFLVHNTKTYLDRSVHAYFEELYPTQRVELKEKPESCAGTSLGVFVLVDGVASYFAKTIGNTPEPEEEIVFSNAPTIDLIEIFVYILLKLIGLGSTEVHIIPERDKVVFLATRLIDGFRTASGVSTSEMLGNDSSSDTEPEAVVITTEMKRRMRTLSSLLCLHDLLRNQGNHGVLDQLPDELRIVDFGVDSTRIGDYPTILSSSVNFPFLEDYFEKWDLLENIYKAREEMENVPVLKNNKNGNLEMFETYFKRLEIVLKEFANK